MPADIHPSAHGPRLNATRARQARGGRQASWVLVISPILAALALLGAGSSRAQDLAAVEVNNGVKTPAEAQRYDTPQQPAKQTPQ